MKGRVYFLQEAGNGPIKIGYTTGEVRHRWLTIQSHNPRELRCLGVISDAIQADEQDWLQRFHALRIQGEWFWPSAELCAAIAAEAKSIDTSNFFHRPRKKIPEAWAKVQRWMEENNQNVVTFAKVIGCSQPYLSGRINGRAPVTGALAKRIALATGVVSAEDLRWKAEAA